MRKKFTKGSNIPYFSQLQRQLLNSGSRLMLLTLCLLCGGLIEKVHAQGYGFSYSYNTSNVVQINNVTGVQTNIGTIPLGNVAIASALAVDQNGDIYFTSTNAASAVLYKFVPATNTFTNVGTFPASFFADGATQSLSFGKLAISNTGQLFTISSYGAGTRPYIVRINKANASIASTERIEAPTNGVNDLPTSGGDLDFTAGGRLFVSGSFTAGGAVPAAWEINPANGTVLGYKSVSLPAGTAFTNLSGLGFDLQGNAVATTTNAENRVIRIKSSEFSGATSWTGNSTIPASSVSTLGGTFLLSFGDLGSNAYTILGRIYEDVNYGGGAGRTYAAIGSTNGIGGVRVEVYDNLGNLQNFTTSNPDGTYTLGVSSNGIYYVRVVNSTILSTRPGSNATAVPVQTFRRESATVGVFTDIVNEVGGRNPLLTDPGTGTIGTTTINTSTFMLGGDLSGQAQSVSKANIGTTNVLNIDFGYNFSTIVNTNNTGQGSLRQFIINSNVLGNTGLDQVANTIFDPAPGVETSIFMIPDGAAHPGINKPNQLTAAGSGNTAIINLIAVFPPITGNATSIDGRTQTANIGNSQPAVAGSPGTTVGVDQLALPGVSRPEVEIKWNGPTGTSTFGLDVGSNNNIIRGIAINGFGNGNGIPNTSSNINIAGNTNLVTEIIAGGAAVATHTATAISPGANMLVRGTGNSITNNYIIRSDFYGIRQSGDITGLTISGNEIRNNGNGVANDVGYSGAGIEFASGAAANVTNVSVTGNLVQDNMNQGLQVNGSVSFTVTNNTFSGNGATSTAPAFQAERDNIQLIGSQNGVVTRNIITGAASSGVAVNNAGAAANKISQNSIYNNAGLGIDLGPYGDASDAVTPNDNGDGDTGPNGQLNFPVITGAVVVGNNLVLKGFSRPGTNIELFVADRDASFSPTPPLSPNPLPGTFTNTAGFGEGRRYLLTLQEGSGADQDATTGNYLDDGTGNISVRTENRFQFTIPLASISGVVLNTLLTATATDAANNTSEFSGVIPVTYGDQGDAPDSYSTLFSSNGPVHVVDPRLKLGATVTGELTALAVAAGTSANAPSGDASDDGLTTPLPVINTATTVYTLTFPVTNTTGATANLVGWIDFNRNNVFDPAEQVVTTVANNGTSAVLTWNNASALMTGNGVNGGLTYARFRLTTEPVANIQTGGVMADGEVEDYSLLIERAYDLAVTKVASPDPVVAGAPLTYTLTVTNNGASGIVPSDVITLTDNLPVDFTATGYVPASGVYNSTNGQWSGLNLAAGQTTTLTISGQLSAAAIGTLQNTAIVKTPAGILDANIINDTARIINTINRVLDLALTKTASPKPAVAGSPLTYTITLTNNGPASLLPADVVTVTDNLPAGFTASSYAASAGTYNSGNGQWSGLTLSVGQTATITITGTVDASFTGTSLVNTVTATPPTGTTDPTPPTGKDSTTVNRVIDLNLTKTASPKPAVAGQALTYTITLSNAGPGAIVPGDTVTVTDNLPADFTANTFTPATGTYNSTTGKWTGISLGAGQSTTLTITGMVSASYTGNGLVNIVTVTPPTGTTDPTPPTGKDSTGVSRVMDLVLAKTASPKPAVAGSSLTYTITLTNNGPASLLPADVVTVTDNLPAGFTASSYVASAGTYTSGNGQWSGLNLTAGQSAIITITGAVAANFTGTSLVNTVTATPPTGTTDPTPPTGKDSTTVNRVIDLNLTKTASPKPAVAGQALTYTITLSNAGPGAIVPGDTVTVTDNLPADFTANTFTPATGTYNSTTGKWTGISLTAGQSTTLTITGTVSASYTGNGLVNIVTVTPPTGTTDPTPPTGKDSTGVSRVMDLVLAKTASPKPAVAGSPLTYTITLTNNGPASLLPADVVTVTDNLPAGFTASSYAASAGTYNSGNGQWSGLTLSVGQTATITITGAVDASFTGTSLVNTVTATPPTGTTDPTPPTGKDSTTVNRVIDINLTKTASPKPAVAGQALTYTITLSNAGPGAIVPGDTVTVTDNLPADFTANTFTPATGTYNSTTGKWTGISLTVGQSTTLTITGTVSASYTGSGLVNIVTVTPPTGTTDPTPPTGKDSTGVSRVMDLVLAKTASPKPAVAGSPLTYTITLTNNGPASLLPADVVTVTDNLPAGFTASSYAASAGTYNSGNGQWSGLTLSVGQTATITITGAVDASFTGTSLVNTVTATPPTGTTDPTPPTGKDSTTVNRVIDLNLTKTASPKPAVAGQALTYTITLSNAGPGAIVPGDTVTVTDNLPADFTANTFTPATGTYNSTTGKWTGISLGAGQSTTLTITGTVSASYTGSGLVNIVTVTPPTGTTDPTPPTGKDSTGVSRVMDLVLAKTASPKPAVAGSPLTYTITLTNNGPAVLLPADVVTVTDNLPAGFTASSYVASAGTYTSGNGQWSGLNLTAGQSATITIAGTVSAAAAGPLVNMVTAVPPPGTTDPTPPVGKDSTVLTHVADLAITKTDGAATYTPGTASIYTIVVSNNGPSDVVGATVNDPLPAGITNAGWTVVLGAGANAPANSGSGAINQVVDIPAGSNITYTLTLNVPAGFTGNLTNTATVTAPAGYTDNVPGNNTATDNNTIRSQYNLAANKMAPASVDAGTGISYTITYTNNGPSDVVNALLTDTLAAGITGVSWTAAVTGNATVSATSGGGNNMIGLNGSLPAGATNKIVVTINGTVQAGATGVLTNKAWITPPDNTPPVPSNTTSTTIKNATGINIVKTGPPSGTISAGGTVTYNILVTNEGPSDAVNVAITDAVPGILTGVTWVATAGGRSTIAGGSPLNGTGNNVSLTANIPAGAGNEISIIVTGTMPSDASPGNVENLATATPVGAPPVNSKVVSNVTNDPVFVISKTGPATIAAGDNITYTIEVENTGLSDAKNAIIKDNIPVQVSGVTWTTSTVGTATVVSGGSGNSNALNVTVNIPAGTGNKVIVTVTGKVDPATSGNMVNTARITYPAKPDVPSNTVTTNITNTPGLHLSKSGPATISAGELITYTLLLTNTGPSDATDAQIVDTLASQLTNVNISSAVTGDANVSASTLTGNIVNVTGNISAGTGNSIAVTITGVVDPAFAGNIVNRASVTLPGKPAVPATPVTTVVTNDPGIKVTKSGPANISAGQSISYAIQVTNSGPSNAMNVAIADIIPTKVQNPVWTAVGTGNGTTVSAGNGSGDVNITGNIPAGAGNMITIMVTGKVDPAYIGTIVNNVSAGVPGKTPATATTSTQVTNNADVQISKSGPAAIQSGQAVSYTLLVTNNGPSDATNVEITDKMPAGLINVSWTTATSGTGTTVSTTGGAGDVNVIGNIPGGAGHVITITVNATVDPAFTGATIRNVAVVVPPGKPPVTSDTITTPVTISPDIQITKSGPDKVSAGTQLTYTIDVTNNGPSDARNVAISDNLPVKLLSPSWMVITSGTNTTASALNGSGNVSITGNIPAGAGNKITITVSGTVDPAYTGTLTNTATAEAPGKPAVTATKNTTIINDPAIEMIKSGPDTAAAGQEVRYTLEITNNGPSDAVNVAIQDNMPAGLAHISWTAVGSDASTTVLPANGTGNVSVTSNIPAGSGHVVTVTITGTVSPAFAGASLDNTATATAPGKPPASSSVITKVKKVSDLQIIKSGPQDIVAGQDVTYHITVTNAGPSDAIGANIQDAVPAALQNVSWTAVANGTGTTVSNAAGTGNNINITGNIPAGTANNITIVVTGKLDPAANGTTVSNTATVTPPVGTTDPTPATSTVTSNVSRETDLVIVKTGPANKAAGQRINYKLVITNNGLSSVKGAAIQDIIPAQITNITFNTSTTGTASVTTAGLTGNTLNINGDIAAGTGNSIVVNIEGTVDPGTPVGNITNTAVVTPPAGVTETIPASNTSSISTAINTAVGLQISKSGPAIANIGDPITYTVEITNTGSSNANNGIITDNVPPEITGVSWMVETTGNGATLVGTASPTGTTLSGTGNNISFAANIEGSTSGPGTVILTVKGTVSAAAGTSITNTARAVFSGIEESTFTTAINKSADLRIAKAGPASIGAGQQITYTIDVVNAGPADATGAVIEDNVPIQIQNVSWTATPLGTAAVPVTNGNGSNAIAITANIPAGAANGVRITITGIVDAAYTGTITNTATATPPAGTPDPTPATSTVRTAVSNVPGLQIMKSGPASIAAGQQITYTIRVKNNGPSNAGSITINDQVPVQILTPVWTATANGAGAAITTGATGRGANVIVTGSLAADNNSDIEIIIKGVVDAAYTGPLSNVATVTPGGGGTPVTSPPVITQVTSKPGLQINKSGPAVINAGQAITYTIDVSNNGPSDASNITIRDIVPAQVKNVTWTAVTSAAGASIITGSNGDKNEVLVTGNIAVGAGISIFINGIVDADFTGMLSNTATVASPGGTPVNSTVNTTVNSSPGLRIVKSGPAGINAGQQMAYTIDVTNTGPSRAASIIIDDIVPAALNNVTWTAVAQGTGTGITGSSSGNGNNISITGSIAAGAGNKISILVKGTVAATFTGVLTNTARVSVPGGVPVESTPVTTKVDSRFGLLINKSAPAVALSSETITYVLRVTNAGPSTALAAIITDDVPGGVTNVSWTTATTGNAVVKAGGTGTGGNVKVTADIPAGISNEVIVTITGKIDPNYSGSLKNMAKVTPPGKEPIPTDTSTTTVRRNADIRIVKSGPAIVAAGAPITYTIDITNAGPGNVGPVTIVDAVPASITVASWKVTAVSGTSNITGPSTGTGNAINTQASLNSGAQLRLTITGMVTQAAAGSLRNTATATLPPDVVDPTPDNSSTVITTVVKQVGVKISKTGPAVIRAGQKITYTIVTTNTGPSDATAVQIVDDVPEQLNGVTWTATAIGKAGITAGGNGTGRNVSVTGDIAAGEGNSIRITVTGTVPVNVGGVLTNTAMTIVPGIPVNNITPPVNTVINKEADLQITKRGPASIIQGQIITYQITVRNNGPAAANGATFQDIVPATIGEINAVVTTQSGGAGGTVMNVNGNTVTGTIALLPPGASVSVTINGKVNGTAVLSNVASVTPPPDVTDPIPGNNTTPPVITPVTPGNPPVANDDEATTNAATPVIIPVLINDKNGTGVIDPSTVVITVQPQHGKVVVHPDGTVTYTPDAGYSGPDNFRYTVKDSNGAVSNPAIVIITVAKSADLVVNKTVTSAGPYHVGQQITYSITVSNKGPDAATGVFVTDVLPVNVSAPASITASKGTAGFDITSNTLSWNVGALNNGESSTLTFIVRLTGSGDILNKAVTSGNEPDPDPLSNESAVTVTVTGEIFIPNVITPNGDGKNDRFVIPNLGKYPGTSLFIYNRWGNMVYQSKNYDNKWDGNGLNEGTYYYILKLNTPTGIHDYKGWIELLR